MSPCTSKFFSSMQFTFLNKTGYILCLYDILKADKIASVQKLKTQALPSDLFLIEDCIMYLKSISFVIHRGRSFIAQSRWNACFASENWKCPGRKCWAEKAT